MMAQLRNNLRQSISQKDPSINFSFVGTVIKYKKLYSSSEHLIGHFYFSNRIISRSQWNYHYTQSALFTTALYHQITTCSFYIQSFFQLLWNWKFKISVFYLAFCPILAQKQSQRQKLQNISTHYYVKSQTYTKTEKVV